MAVQINPSCTSETDNKSGRILEDTTNAASALAAVLYMLQQVKRSWRYFVIKMKRNSICYNTFSPVAIACIPAFPFPLYTVVLVVSGRVHPSCTGFNYIPLDEGFHCKPLSCNWQVWVWYQFSHSPLTREQIRAAKKISANYFFNARETNLY